MFKKKPRVEPGTTDTLIGEGTVFQGSLSSKADIRIEGRVIGEITSVGEVTIGEKGFVQSEITARDVVIAGRLEGKVTASGRLTITPTGQLQGTVQAEALIVEQGARFQGTSEMSLLASAAASEASASEEGGSASGPAQPVPTPV